MHALINTMTISFYFLQLQKRKLSDMLGPRWTMEELTRFYDSYRKNGKDWKKVDSSIQLCMNEC